MKISDSIRGLKVSHKNNPSFILDFLMGLGIPFTYVTFSGKPFPVRIKIKNSQFFVKHDLKEILQYKNNTISSSFS